MNVMFSIVGLGTRFKGCGYLKKELNVNISIVNNFYKEFYNV